MIEPKKSIIIPEILKKEEKENSEIEYNDEKILSEKNILIVGSGGLGCELLKLLVINGFKKTGISYLDDFQDNLFQFSKDDKLFYYGKIILDKNLYLFF